MRLLTILILICLTCVVGGTYYSVFNASEKFAAYKSNYKKKYPNMKVEKEHFLNFLENLNQVTKLNENSNDTNTTYVLNKYADLDPREVHQRYSINLVPYTRLRNGDKLELLRTDNGIEISSSQLHDLNNAEALYKKYQIDNRINIKSKYDRTARYYRFIKTLVEKNKEIFEGKSDLELNNQSDVIQHETEFFY